MWEGSKLVWLPLSEQSFYNPAGLDNYLRSRQLPEIMLCVIHILCVMALKVLLQSVRSNNGL